MGHGGCGARCRSEAGFARDGGRGGRVCGLPCWHGLPQKEENSQKVPVKEAQQCTHVPPVLGRREEDCSDRLGKEWGIGEAQLKRLRFEVWN